MQDRLNSFMGDFKKWIDSIGLPSIKCMDKKEIQDSCNLSYYDLNNMSIDELNSLYLDIMKFMNNLSTSIHELQTVLDYCESSINYIICDKLIKVDAYVKAEIKSMYCIKNDTLCKDLLKIQIDSRAKLSYLKDRMNFFVKMTDMIDLITKRKIYDRSN